VDHQLHLPLEAIAEDGVGGNVVVHHLDDHLTAQVELRAR